MRLTVLYDNEAKKGFEAGWGFSCLIEHNMEKLLFDTGWDGNLLLRNMQRINVGAGEIDWIILSHIHWDHIGGLNHVIHPRAKVVVPASFTRSLKEEIAARAELVEVMGRREITAGVHSLGELGKDIKEQSLWLSTGGGTVVLTGCAHPGLEAIMEAARPLGRLRGVIGGFHDFENVSALRDLHLVVPCHCTKRKQEIMDLYPEAVRLGLAGMVLEPD